MLTILTRAKARRMNGAVRKKTLERGDVAMRWLQFVGSPDVDGCSVGGGWVVELEGSVVSVGILVFGGLMVGPMGCVCVGMCPSVLLAAGVVGDVDGAVVVALWVVGWLVVEVEGGLIVSVVTAVVGVSDVLVVVEGSFDAVVMVTVTV